MRKKIPLSQTVFYFESRILPILLSLYIAIELNHFLTLMWNAYESPELLSTQQFFQIACNYLIAICLYVAFIIALWKRKASQQSAQSKKEVFIPYLIFIFLFSPKLMPYLPAEYTELLFPQWAQSALSTVLGTSLVVLGASLTLWALTHLNKNFSIAVSVNEVVRSGPYRFVRHPMYIGQVMAFLGSLLWYPTIVTGLFFIAFTLIQVTRANLEDNRLKAHREKIAA